MPFVSRQRDVLAELAPTFTIQLLDAEVRPVIEDVLTTTNTWNKRRCPLQSPLVVWLLIGMALHRNLSIPNVFKRILDGYSRENVAHCVTPEALWRARERLGSEPLKQLFERLSEREREPNPSLCGYRAWGVDGCRMTLPDTPANVKRFGRVQGSRGPAAYPQTLGVFLVDLERHRLRSCRFEPHSGSERASVLELLGGLNEADILLMDRGISSHEVFSAVRRQGAHFLGRICSNWKPVVRERLGTGDLRVVMTPAKKRRGGLRPEDELEVRLISYKIRPNEIVRLATSLMDPVKYPARELALAYHQRWECELVYKEFKTYLTAVAHGKQETCFRSKNPDAVLQEAWATCTAFNLLRDLISRSCEEHSSAIVRQIEISFVDTLELVRLRLTSTQKSSPRTIKREIKDLRANIARFCRIARPRRLRTCPRVVKRKMSNFKLKRPGDNSCHLDAKRSLHLVDIP